ncbi:MAG: HlyD family efflux transporter periplasmic adaptor subunit [Bacteroidota bacterium]
MSNNEKIFPAEFIALTTEYHFHKYNPRTLIIYRFVLGLVFLTLFAMFFIKVNINVKSAGIIKSQSEHNEIKSLVSARVDSVFVKENMKVKKGQVLIILKADALAQQGANTQTQQGEFKAQLADLEKLTTAAQNRNWKSRPELTSSLYNQQYILFLQRIRDLAATSEAATRNYKRYKYLYDNAAISAAEYDAALLGYRNAQSALQLVYDEQGSKWQAELSTLKNQVRGLQSEGQSLEEEKDFYTIRAPISGTIQSLKGIQPGSLLAANENIAEISPDGALIAETYVLPKDIGLVHPGTEANFQVDAFNYNEWGMLSGKVVSVSNDVFTAEGQQPYFKVRCQLESTGLKLKNGYVGRLKKGMGLQANFFVTKRTLFQLLYDKADDWLNPNKMPAPKATE